MTTKEKSIDDKVAEIFDELQAALLEKKNFHPSEIFYKVDFESEYSSSKIFRIINYYHVYCNLCNHHLYSRSEPLDINSFFQKHINTDYHQQRCNEKPCPNSIPMFTWQEKWHSGRCNVCEMPNINAYVIDTDVNFSALLLNHDCFWKKIYENGNELFLTKLRSLKTYCGLSFFCDKLIKKINGKTACSLCSVLLSGSEKKDRHHFTSNHHYTNFVILIFNMFNFLPKDLLNGFNLEYVTRCFLEKDFPVPTELLDLKEREKCLKASNSDPILRDFAKLDAGKSLQIVQPELPASLGRKYFEKILKEKLELVELVFSVKTRTKGFCEICDQIVPISSQESHLVGTEHGFQVEKWESVKRSLQNPKYFEPFLKVSGVIICLICKNILLDFQSFFSHLKGSSHREKFGQYLQCKFPHPISSTIKIRPDFTSYCLICMISINRQPTLPMLKANLKNLHWPCPSIWKNERSKKKKKPSTFSESNEETNFNREPNDEMNRSREFEEEMNSRRGSDEEINLSRELIDEHGEREANVDPKYDENTSEPDPISGVEHEVVNETKTKEQREPISIDFDRPDFRTVEKSLEGIMEAFEGKIVEHVKDKSVSLLRSMAQSKGTFIRKDTSVVKPEKAENQQPIPLEEESKPEINFVENHGNHELGDKQEKHKKANENMKGKAEKVKEQIKRKNRDDIPVLVVKGLPKSRFKYQTFLNKFNGFGPVRSMNFKRNELIVNFTKAGVAESIVKDHPDFVKTVFPQDLKLELEIRRLPKKGSRTFGCVNKDVAVLLENPAKLLKFVQRLVHESIIACESQVEINREEQVCRTIIKAVSDSFPQSRCYPFGSRLSGLTLHNSDIDIFMDSGGVYDGINSKSGRHEKALIKRIAGLLRKMRSDIINLTVVARARVPIISFVHKPTALHCDLSFKNGLSVQNTMLLKFITSLDPRVKSLILFLKHWVNLNEIHGPPYFSSYAIAMMTLYFLQQLPSPVVPTIESLQKAFKGRRMTIGGWDCSFISNAEAVPKTENVDGVPELLAGFFSFYANFDYAKYVISPLTGKPLPKEALSGKVKLPMAYKRHVLNIPFDDWKSSFTRPLCVLDPFDLGHVLTKSLTSDGLQLFIHLCKRSHDLLKKTPGQSDQKTNPGTTKKPRTNITH